MRFTTGLPCPYRRPRSELPQNWVHAPELNLTQLKTLILVVEFYVKVEIAEGVDRSVLTLKRPLGDISERGAGGGILYCLPCPYCRPRRIMGQISLHPPKTQHNST